MIEGFILKEKQTEKKKKGCVFFTGWDCFFFVNQLKKKYIGEKKEKSHIIAPQNKASHFVVK